MNVLLTGGAGYIGSHVIIELVKAGHTPIVIDNFSNSSPESIRRVGAIVGHDITLYEGDVANHAELSRVFDAQAIDAVIHLAGLKAVGESVEQPLRYYRNNLDASLTLCEVMQERHVHSLVFSSSATVYGDPEELPLKETSHVGRGITNPYGQTKYMIEQILHDTTKAHSDWSVTLLRYFNPIGADESGTIGEDPAGIPNNLLPYVAQVAVGKRPQLNVFGNDYDTPDGTCLRDYIHVVDLARGHVAALEHMTTGTQIYNLGTGKGVSVLEVIAAFEQASGRSIPYTIAEQRAGDVAVCYADASKAREHLGWTAEKSLEDACRDAWRWQSSNPNGYSNS